MDFALSQHRRRAQSGSQYQSSVLVIRQDILVIEVLLGEYRVCCAANSLVDEILTVEGQVKIYIRLCCCAESSGAGMYVYILVGEPVS